MSLDTHSESCDDSLMDIFCPKCGEPWDNDSLHDEAEARQDYHKPGADYETVAREFRSKGCAAFTAMFSGGIKCTRPEGGRNRDAAEAAGALYDLLGDDMDGMASMMEDYGF